jgi:branched-subunit amino acid aminotransferase/4-amino-4-deoxychorismate lyase
MMIYIDGELMPREAARVSVFDHGLLYGRAEIGCQCRSGAVGK